MRNPRSIQEALDGLISEFSSKEVALPRILARVARRQKLKISDAEIQLLASAILNATGDIIQIDLNPPCALGETELEIQATVQALIDDCENSIEDDLDSLGNIFSQVVPEVLGNTADAIAIDLSEQSNENATALANDFRERTEAVQRLWGPVLDRVDLLRHFVLEWRSAALENGKGAFARLATAIALDRLLTRAYEVTGEITTLARAGYADGALARWRTLHEICVTAMFISKRSDLCAEMYLLHHVVEELKLIKVDGVTGGTVVPDIRRDRYLRQLRLRKAALVRRFGEAYADDYGWASVELGRSRTTFRDLENHVGLELLRKGYQRANSAVHGGALAALTRISLGPVFVDGAEFPPAHGCEVALNHAAWSLSMLVAELCLEVENADLLAMAMLIHRWSLATRCQIEGVQRRSSNRSSRDRLSARRMAQRATRAAKRPRFRR